MAGSIYIALSGMHTRMAQLDRVASDLANESTAGYKGERAGTVAVGRPSFDSVLDAAVDTAPALAKIDFGPGEILPTGRDLDMAVDGSGFFVVQTPAGPRYTRNGHFSRSADGTLVTGDGMPVMGQGGPIKLTEGQLVVKPDGTIAVDRAPAGKLQIVDFGDYARLDREERGRFRAPLDVAPVDKQSVAVRGGALEQSNVSVSDRMVHLTEVSRAFESLQRGISMLSNDIDARAITELGRR
ncbi:MAG TPA: flagellar hook basal-body protein [Vicinamibacterales bacterium]|jgi:flagellar basal body rod protein FlgG